MLRGAEMNIQPDFVPKTPENRIRALAQKIREKGCIKVLESHSPISALIVENTKDQETGDAYDAFWSSSLTDSTERGKPDIELLDMRSRLTNIREIFEVTTLPMIMDGDTGGKTEHFGSNIRQLEQAGVSAVIIEDKTGLKKNSLFGNEVPQQQDSIENFCAKIKTGKAAQLTTDFYIIARIESLILEQGMDDALTRAFAYVGAGADAIMIHSRQKTPDEVLEFAAKFREKEPEIVLVCVPTSYTQISFDALKEAGFNVVIYANHMLRSSYLAMQNVALQILKNGRSHEVEPVCLGVKDILNLIPGTH